MVRDVRAFQIILFILVSLLTEMEAISSEFYPVGIRPEDAKYFSRDDLPLIDAHDHTLWELHLRLGKVEVGSFEFISSDGLPLTQPIFFNGTQTHLFNDSVEKSLTRVIRELPPYERDNPRTLRMRHVHPSFPELDLILSIAGITYRQSHYYLRKEFSRGDNLISLAIFKALNALGFNLNFDAQIIFESSEPGLLEKNTYTISGMPVKRQTVWSQCSSLLRGELKDPTSEAYWLRRFNQSF